MDIIIRPARQSDIASLQAIEIDAFETLRDAGGVSGEASSTSEATFRDWLGDGIVLAAVDHVDQPLGYGSALFKDDRIHICELDVARSSQGRGIGRALMQALLVEGRKCGLSGATLTTDRLAPFNAPFYASLGFRILAEAELSDRLRLILANEHAMELDPARRVAMELMFE